MSETQTVPASEPQTGPVDFRTLAAAFGIALVIGIPAAAAALLFMGLIHKVQQGVFDHLPDALGIDGLPAWWVIAMTTAGALLALAAIGFSIFTGIGRFGGLPAESLAVPSLPVYENVALWHLVPTVLLALVAASLVVVVRVGATRLSGHAVVRPAAVLLAGGVAIGVLAVLFRELADEPVDLVLFSGTETLPETLALTSTWVVLGLVVAKGLAYAICLGCGFRGGPIFPAIAIGVALAVASHDLIDSFPLTAAFVAGSAAAGAAQMQLPFAGAILALLLAGNAGANTVAIAAVGATVSYLVRLGADRRLAEDDPAATA